MWYSTLFRTTLLVTALFWAGAHFAVAQNMQIPAGTDVVAPEEYQAPGVHYSLGLGARVRSRL